MLSSEPLDQVVPPKEKQTPLLRYQMQTALEAIREDTKRYLAVAEYLVHADNHFFIQQLAFEAIGDSTEPTLLDFVLRQKELPQYRECIRRGFNGSIGRIEYLVRTGIRAFACCDLLPELADEFYHVLRLGRLLPICDIIFEGVSEIVRSCNSKTQYNAWQIQTAISETSRLIAFLYKECIEEHSDETANKCLDAWDKMLILGFDDMRQITEDLDGVI